jgi:phage FluMu protein gp41
MTDEEMSHVLAMARSLWRRQVSAVGRIHSPLVAAFLASNDRRVRHRDRWLRITAAAAWINPATFTNGEHDRFQVQFPTLSASSVGALQPGTPTS